MKRNLFIIIALICSVYAHGQTNNNTAANNEATNANADTTDNTNQSAAKKLKLTTYFFGDFGESLITAPSDVFSTTAHGITSALCGQVAYRIKPKQKVHRMYISAGLEVRNFNGVSSGNDGEGITAYDNLHYWYAGIPIMFQYVNCKHKTGSLRDIRFYGQGAITTGIKVKMTDFYSDDGTNTKTDITNQFAVVMIHTSLSAGMTYSTKNCTFLLGPYLDYNLTNASKADDSAEDIVSLGIRLTYIPGLTNK